MKSKKAAVSDTRKLQLGALAILLFIALMMGLLLPAQSRVETATVSIPSGVSASRVAAILHDAQVLRSPLLFRVAARLAFVSRRFHAGEYRFSTRQNIVSLLIQLTKGEVALYSVTLPEGLRMEESFKRVEEAGLASSEQLLALARDSGFCKELGVSGPSLEGFVSPETYNFPKAFGERNILRAMVERFRASTGPDYEALAAKRGLTLEQALILASLVENEAYEPQERPRIAAVFLNRLKKGMKLESCASILYALGHHKHRLYEKDLQVVSPYNTYLHHGLPPGPICSPGKESLRAVVEPEDSPYLFFVARQDGSHEFSKTFEEHLKAKARAEKKPGKKV